MIFKNQKVAIISPHLDDETLGVGGTISKFIKYKSTVSVLFVSTHMPPLYEIKETKKIINESVKAMRILGVKNYEYLNIPATKINEIEIYKFNKLIKNFLNKVKPSIVFIPFNDRHIDHRLVFDACMVATRPIGKNYPKIVLAYETLSETFWNAPGIESAFVPELFVDITENLNKKKISTKML